MVRQATLELAETLCTKYPIQTICRHLNIPRSTFYRWKNNTSDQDSLSWLEIRIKELCKRHRFRYGYRKITALLRKEFTINHKPVQRIMQKYNWQCRVKVKRRKNTGQPFHVADNLFKRNFEAQEPRQKLVTDITYLPFGNKMMYLSSIQDLYNGEIIAYSIGDKQDVSLVLDTLKQVKNVTPGCILHSDQGSVYTSYSYQTAVQKKGITMSMSRKGTPADNAPIESFHSCLKSETFYLEELRQTTTAIVVKTVQEYIHYFNNTRIQLKLNNQSPVEYRKLVA